MAGPSVFSCFRGANPGAEVCHESHVLLAGGGVWGPGGEKIIQVIVVRWRRVVNVVCASGDRT